MAKRIVILLLLPLVAALLVLGAVEIWLVGYPAEHSEEAMRLERLTTERLQKRQALAADPLQNGALALQDRETLTGLARPGKEPTAADFQAYEKALPQLELALARPDFLVVEPADGSYLRALVDSLLKYAGTRPPARALELDLLALELAARVESQGTSTTMMIGVGMQRSVDKALFALLNSGKLSQADCARLAARLEAFKLAPNLLLERMDEDYVGFLRYTQGQVGANGFSQQVLIMVPGFVAREQRLYQNLYVRDRASLEKDFQLTGPPDELQTLNDHDHAFVVALGYPLYPKIRLQWARALTELSALRAMARLEQAGKYPAALDARDFLAPDGRLLYQRTPAGYTLRSGYTGTEIEPASLKFR